MSDYWDPDYEDYYDAVQREELEEEGGYTGRPIPEGEGPRGAEVHHINCPWQEGETYENCECESLWEKCYQDMRDREVEELHEQYWS